MELETVIPNCEASGDPINVWEDNYVVDAYQKDGFNHYEFACPSCGKNEFFSVEIEKSN